MKIENKATSSGIGFVGLLQIVFIVLRLCKVITWKWIWVLAPAWIFCALVAVMILVAIIVACVKE